MERKRPANPLRPIPGAVTPQPTKPEPEPKPRKRAARKRTNKGK